jgi:hypothetical protein
VIENRGEGPTDRANATLSLCYFGTLAPNRQATVRFTVAARKPGFYSVSLSTGPFSCVSATTQVLPP